MTVVDEADGHRHREGHPSGRWPSSPEQERKCPHEEPFPERAGGVLEEEDCRGPGLMIVSFILCGPLALVAVPALAYSGYTFLQVIVVTWFIQVAAILVGLMIGFCFSPTGSAQKTKAEDETSQNAVPDVDIWRFYSQDRLSSEAGSVALIAADTVQTRQIARDLAGQGYDIHHTSDSEAMFETVRTHPFDWNFLIFDLDLHDDLQSSVEDLMSFRKDCSSVPILLLSGSTSRDEFSDHRHAIGDATLRKPVFRTRLLAGIDAMKANCRDRRGASERFLEPNRLCCTNPPRDSSRESSVVAGMHEQTDTPYLQDQELAGL